MSSTKRTGNMDSQAEGTTSISLYFVVPFNEITKAGAYYNNATGGLYRIPDEGLALAHSPVVEIMSSNKNLVTRISDDPQIPLVEARQICSDMGVAVNF